MWSPGSTVLTGTGVAGVQRKGEETDGLNTRSNELRVSGVQSKGEETDG